MHTIFEWDDEKERKNREKHNISFDTAAHIFSDPFVLFEPIFENGEYRWKALGKADNQWLLLVVHTVREEANSEVIRIISARKAERKERNYYEQNRSL